jgi:hypothetical protein
MGGVIADIAKQIVKTGAETGVSGVNAVRNIGSVGLALSKGQKTAKDYSNTSYKVPFLGETKPLFTGDESTLEMVKRGTGAGIELGTTFLAGPELKSSVAILRTIGSKSIKELTKQEIKQFTLAYTKKVLSSTLSLGPLYGVGISLKDDANLKQTAQNIAVSTATVFALEAALAPILARVIKTKPELKVKDVVKELDVHVQEGLLNDGDC